MATIALVTDLGTDGWFAGELKGTILSLNAMASPVDLTHAIPRGCVADGAFALLASYRSFPEETVFLSAVDYGSAGARVIAAKSASHIFVAPDNGLLSWVLRREMLADVREVNIEEYLLPSGCSTFPARDLLAPLAAALSDWLAFENCGELTSDYVKLEWPEPQADMDGGKVSGAVVYIDRFGNAITSISPRELAEACGKSCACVVDGREIPVVSHYKDVPVGSALSYPGSAGLMEVAINGGRAAEALNLKIGSEVCFVRG
ncbi:MAG: SAM-dependent chlorinase/fluorinase [Chitinispirillia bacterium]|nr:SAM-dependent chlorinase/fluorinase [Chitinispirillia bacterium]MCL2269135.1 SAM-dependent chlorinase/fluorinase [Chitinispirillia bacterium]